MSYTLTANGAFAIRSDGAFVPWDAANNCPLDRTGLAGQIWEGDGSPAPAPYVAPAPRERDIKSECARRIYAVASDNAQKNLTAARADNALSPEDMAAYTAGRAWIAAMQQVSRNLTAVQDATFADDAHWPPCPAEAAALAERY